MKARTKSRHKVWKLFILVGCIVIAGISTISTLYHSSACKSDHTSPSNLTKKKIARIHDIKPAPRKKQTSTKEFGATRPARMERGVEVVNEIVYTNQSGGIVETLTLADGRKVEKVRYPKDIFSNPSDNIIALALSFKPGQHMPPLPNLSTLDEDFAKSLLDPIRINDEDPDNVKEIKLAVKEAKAYIASEIRNGRSVQECLNEHRFQMESIADSHLMAIQEIRKLQAEGASDEEIATFRQRINEVFRERSVPELPASKSQEVEAQ